MSAFKDAMAYLAHTKSLDERRNLSAPRRMPHRALLLDENGDAKQIKTYDPDWLRCQLDDGSWVDVDDIMAIGWSGSTEVWEYVNRPQSRPQFLPPRGGMRSGKTDISDHLRDPCDLDCACHQGTPDEESVKEARRDRQEARERPDRGRPVSVRSPRAIEAGGGE